MEDISLLATGACLIPPHVDFFVSVLANTNLDFAPL